MTFDYDRWLESPYTDAEETPRQECDGCEGSGLDETETQKCNKCDGEGMIDMDKCDGCNSYHCHCDDYDEDDR